MRFLAASIALAACAPSRPAPGDTTALGRALGALRRSVVGERSAPETMTVAMRRDSLRLGTRGGSPPFAHGATRDSSPPYHSSADRIPTTADSAYGDPADWPTRVIPFTSTTAPAITIWLGDTLRLDAPPVPDGTPPSIARDLRWTSMEPSVATVAAGTVTPRAPGTASIVAWRRVGETVTPLVVRPAIRGRVVAADDSPVRARVVARVGRWTDSAWTGPGGWFVLRPDRPLDGAATVRVVPDDPAIHAAALDDTPLDRLADVDVVLLPTRWRIAAGTYAGTTVPIRPSIASSRLRDALRLWHLARVGRGGAPDAGEAVGWAAERLPLKLAFDHDARGGPIARADSVAFWRAAEQLQRDLGMSVFVPATVPAGDADFAGIVVTLDPRIRAEGLTTAGWNGDGDLYDAVVAMRTRALLADPGVVTHELLHALGVGHAPYGLPSVMHPVGDASTTRATAEDVAYAQLLYAVRARSRTGRTLVGIESADESAPARRP
ncbi:hypothetical protein J421_1515 [Gemmatirosa kalamazoonensis]|uniref:Uncharacterized protein n=1 Tax=Gemmatirosa kalamazoonensis TaxID=861299 RepID=W0RF30_9BACT|nr:hypothetical protein [Gemmatirosa kalamazoonensis]AHG89052.1 hypothetical protein J421_1515 [Gemmatirosa kalamazoonensis]